MYTTATCPYCDLAKRLLAGKGIEAQQIRVDVEPAQLQAMIARTGRRSVPQIFVGATHVGGYDDLSALARSGQLDALLAGAQGRPEGRR